MDIIRTYLAIVIPLAIIQIGLMVAALIHIFRHKKYRHGSRLMWVLVVIFINTIGPILYFVLGREDS
ncbi:PLD nuclease N-terminal domain-containing protein [Candidatus Saccharibacteria bacterium]|nr:PLD nuclease N-terminal domain-containing protein [Candidatus Saccharibacteria bacterium]